jgi:hypothetical protein
MISYIINSIFRSRFQPFLSRVNRVFERLAPRQREEHQSLVSNIVTKNFVTFLLKMCCHQYKNALYYNRNHVMTTGDLLMASIEVAKILIAHSVISE